MNSRSPQREAHRLDGVLDLVKEALNASAALIYWIDSTYGSPLASDSGAARFIAGYNDGMGRFDPINVHSVVEDGRPVAFLQQRLGGSVTPDTARYAKFMRDTGFANAATIVLRDEGEPLIGIGVMKTLADPPATAETEVVADAIRRYLERELIFNPAVRQRYLARKLTTRFGLSPREVEVMNLIADGAANHDISVALGIGAATVKTHLQRSFDKLGVGSRAAAMRMLLEPKSWLRPG
ncbi:MAG TPA: LuxR C-terminal-related transcriptional regulator [Kaistia sp.]|nr:LuxR C-terminal-related transcriptional regulator [Kaistia sp.]